MGYVTPEQIQRAKDISALDYILSHESGAFNQVGSGYRLKEHPSLVVNDKGFYWHSCDIGGRTALDYLVKVRGYAFVDAVSHLTNKSPAPKPASKKSIPAWQMHKDHQPRQHKPSQQHNQQTIILPRRNRDNRRIIAYLQSRGIDKDTITECINRGCLYESAYYHNAVFLGKNERGEARFAAMRAIAGGFMRDAEGSDKRYGFYIPPNDNVTMNSSTDCVMPDTNMLAIFESPIDALSHQSLCRQGFIPAYNGWRLSLGGTSILALVHFLEIHPSINHCYICTDNDLAGNKAAAKLAAKLSNMPEYGTSRAITSQRAPPPSGCDWNDTLQIIKGIKPKETPLQLCK